MSKRVLLIDGDTVVYQFACGLQRDIDWGDGVVSSHADLEAGKKLVDEFVQALIDEFKTDYLRIALSDPEKNWRKEVLPSYKENRKDFVRPILWSELREHLRYRFDVYVRPTLEGDDIVGILATHPRIITGNKILVGIDKDLLTIPGVHYNPRTKVLTKVSEAEADWYHLYQTLVGDPIDNYKGCPYVGPVKARKILGEPGEMSLKSMWEGVVLAFEARGLTYEHALQQARVARICRHGDYDYVNRKVILWNPPS